MSTKLLLLTLALFALSIYAQTTEEAPEGSGDEEPDLRPKDLQVRRNPCHRFRCPRGYHCEVFYPNCQWWNWSSCRGRPHCVVNCSGWWCNDNNDHNDHDDHNDHNGH